MSRIVIALGGNALGKEGEGGVLLVVEVEDVALLVLGDYQHMAGSHGVDVKECEETVVLGHLV